MNSTHTSPADELDQRAHVDDDDDEGPVEPNDDTDSDDRETRSERETGPLPTEEKASIDDELDALELLERQVKAKSAGVLEAIDDELETLKEKEESLLKRRDRLTGGPAPQRVAPDAPSVVHTRHDEPRKSNTFKVGQDGSLAARENVAAPRTHAAIRKAAKAVEKPAKKEKAPKAGKMSNTARVIAYVLEHAKSRVSDIAAGLKLTPPQVSMILQRQKKEGAVKQAKGEGRDVLWSAVG